MVKESLYGSRFDFLGIVHLNTFNLYWLVVSTPLKNISQLGSLFPIYGKIKKKHQPVYVWLEYAEDSESMIIHWPKNSWRQLGEDFPVLSSWAHGSGRWNFTGIWGSGTPTRTGFFLNGKTPKSSSNSYSQRKNEWFEVEIFSEPSI